MLTYIHARGGIRNRDSGIVIRTV